MDMKNQLQPPPHPQGPQQWNLSNPQQERIINSKRPTSRGLGPLTSERGGEAGRGAKSVGIIPVSGQDCSSPNETPGHYPCVYCLSWPGKGRDQLYF